MERFTSVAEVRAWSRSIRAGGDRLAFVPTMGALHEGHLSLVDLARTSCDHVAVSLFVNPAQFGPAEDFEAYPRDLERDAAMLASRGADVLFLPQVEEIYPDGASTWVVETDLSGRLEGVSRPGHFRGVTTVVAILLGAVEPHVLVMGQKDAQQAAVVGRMIRDLRLDVEVVRAPILREGDGLALSSRNAYLSPTERAQAAVLSASLREARTRREGGERDPSAILEMMIEMIEAQSAAQVDYVAAVDPETFEAVPSLDGDVLFCVAAFIGGTRLIDNELVEP